METKTTPPKTTDQYRKLNIHLSCWPDVGAYGIRLFDGGSFVPTGAGGLIAADVSRELPHPTANDVLEAVKGFLLLQQTRPDRVFYSDPQLALPGARINAWLRYWPKERKLGAQFYFGGNLTAIGSGPEIGGDHPVLITGPVVEMMRLTRNLMKEIFFLLYHDRVEPGFCAPPPLESLQS